ncbi:MAG: hypothetical protein KatS3mg031_2188 [Chitinophagales bacterium]|nr:MAG: hypothetical protein KatS3mg031_2188 [Chitinophagales bacterium]
MIIDILFLLFALSGFIAGVARGLISSLFSFVGLFAGAFLAIKYSYDVALWMQTTLDISFRLLPLVAFLLIFAGVFLLVEIIIRILEKVANMLLLGLFNKILGGLLWGALMTLLYSILLWYVEQCGLLSESLKLDSYTFAGLITVPPAIMHFLSLWIPAFQNMMHNLEQLLRQQSSG